MLVGILLLLILNIGNAKTVKSQKKSKSKSETKQKVDKKQDKANEKFLKEMEDFRMEAVIRTTKGDINVFLYPEAAPKNVANFVFLAKNGFYDGLSFSKITFPEAIVQGVPSCTIASYLPNTAFSSSHRVPCMDCCCSGRSL